MIRARFAVLLSIATLSFPVVLHAQDATEPEASATEQADAPKAKKPQAHNPGTVAPTINGPSGLFRVVTTDIGRRHTFRVGLNSEMFTASQFLVCTKHVDGECTEGDDNSRFAGTLAVSYTPWQYLEFFANFRSQANSNTRDDKNRIDQEVILALGDFGFGAKGQYPVAKGFGLGANLSLNFLNSVGGVSVDGDAVSFYIGAIASLDLGALADFPLRFHTNVGFMLDNSNKLANFDNYPLSSLQVEKFALGMNPSRMQIKVGLDLQLRKWVGFGLAPIMEWNFDIATADVDLDFDNNRFVEPNGPLTGDDIVGRATIWTTLGARVNPVAGLNVQLGIDIGVVSPGYGFGPPVIPWNIILGASYAYDPNPPTRVVTKEKFKRVIVNAKPKEGKVRGRIVNAKTLEPVEGAVVTFPGKDLTGLSSDPDGGFLSYPFPNGKLAVMVRHPDYEPAKAMADITVNNVVQLEVKMAPAPPKVGKVNGRVIDLKGAAVTADVSVTGPETKQVRAAADGTFGLELKPGDYTLQFTADGYMRKMHKLQLAAGATVAVDMTLSKRPRRSLVKVTRSSIRIRRKVHFATNTAVLKQDSRQLLDAVVDVLLANPRITKIEIGGHTDNRGSRMRNLELSEARASSVREYLIRNGIQPERLVAKGYGPSKPKVPNITSRNRARNRRVEFKILSQ